MANKLFRTSVMLPNGKRKWIRSKSKEGLEQKKKEVMLQIGTGLDVLDNSTFGEYAEVWFNVYKKPYLRQKSLEALRNALNNHIYPFLRDVPLKKVSPMQIQLIVASLAKNSKSLNDKVIQILRGVFNAAVDNNLIAKSPVPTKIKSKGVRTKEKTALTADQSKRLLDAVSSTRAYLFCLIALQTGMRRGEICGLMWEDIDLDKQIIHVRHNAVAGEESTVIDRLQLHAVVIDHTVGGDSTVSIFNELPSRFLTIQRFQLVNSCTAAVQIHVVVLANSGDVRKICNDLSLLAAEGQVDEILQFEKLQLVGHCLKLCGFASIKAIQPFGEIVQLLHIDRKHLCALEHSIKAVDCLHLAVGFDRVANFQRLQQLHTACVLVMRNRERDGCHAIFRVRWVN